MGLLQKVGIKANVIGKVTEPERGLKMLAIAGMRDLPRFERDEITRFLDAIRRSVRTGDDGEDAI